MLAFAFAAALLLYAVTPDANQREVRAQSGDVSRTVIPRPPVEIHEDADETAPSPNGGQRTIVAPPIPNYPTGSILGAGSVALDWDDVPTATGYGVRVFTGTVWTHLPANGITIEFSGSSAQIDGLPNYDTYYLQVRAANSAGNSRWSGFLDLANDVTNQATSTPAPTATQAPVATPTPTPTATQAPVATPTPTSTATPDTEQSDTASLFIDELVTNVFLHSEFIGLETQFLDCIQRETGARPGSFDAALGGYDLDGIAAFNLCDEETGLTSTVSTLMSDEIERLRQDSRFTDFVDETLNEEKIQTMTDPDALRQAALLFNMLRGSSTSVSSDSSSQVRTPRQPTPSADDWEDCLPTGAPQTFDDKMGIVNCLVSELPLDFWGSEDYREMEAAHQRKDPRLKWIGRGLTDGGCSFGLDPSYFPLKQCLKHDFEYTALAAVVEDPVVDGVTADHGRIDAAWNPRNRSLVELRFYEDVIEHGCALAQPPKYVREICNALDTTVYYPVPLAGTVIIVGMDLRQAAAFAMSESLRRFLPGFWTDIPQWPVTNADIADWDDDLIKDEDDNVLDDRRIFTECDRARVSSHGEPTFTGKTVDVTLNVQTGCVAESEVDKVEICWTGTFAHRANNFDDLKYHFCTEHKDDFSLIGAFANIPVPIDFSPGTGDFVHRDGELSDPIGEFGLAGDITSIEITDIFIKMKNAAYNDGYYALENGFIPVEECPATRSGDCSVGLTSTPTATPGTECGDLSISSSSIYVGQSAVIQAVNLCPADLTVKFSI